MRVDEGERRRERKRKGKRRRGKIRDRRRGEKERWWRKEKGSGEEEEEAEEFYGEVGPLLLFLPSLCSTPGRFGFGEIKNAKPSLRASEAEKRG